MYVTGNLYRDTFQYPTAKLIKILLYKTALTPPWNAFEIKQIEAMENRDNISNLQWCKIRLLLDLLNDKEKKKETQQMLSGKIRQFILSSAPSQHCDEKETRECWIRNEKKRKRLQKKIILIICYLVNRDQSPRLIPF